MPKLRITDYPRYTALYADFGHDSLSEVPKSELIIFKIAPKDTVSLPSLKKVMKVFRSKEYCEHYNKHE